MSRMLSKQQTETLRTLYVTDGWRPAYPGLSLGTLRSLDARGLVKARYEIGSMAMPHTSILWRITDAGRTCMMLERAKP